MTEEKKNAQPKKPAKDKVSKGELNERELDKASGGVTFEPFVIKKLSDTSTP